MVSERPTAAQLARVAASCFERPWSELSFRRELERPDCRTRVARGPGGDVLGYALGRRVLDEVQILSVAVAPHARRLGVARRLLCAWLRELAAEGVTEVSLEVRASNRAARALYRGLGLQRVGERPGYYPGGEAALLYSGAA